jgi:hypothetical protein
MINMKGKEMADQVNVLLHGIFGYVFTPKWIEAYAPAVCGHVYKVSRSRSLAQTKPLPKSDFSLTGVRAGWPFQPDPKASPVVPIAKNTIIDEFGKRFCKICLPYPTVFEGQGQRIWTMDTAYVGSIFCGRDASPLNIVQPFPSMHILSYERDQCGLQFEMDDGSSQIPLDDLPSDAPAGFTNLHIWCTTPPMDMGDMGYTPDGHLRRGFSALVDMYPLLEVTIQFPDGFTPEVGPETLPPGVQTCDVDPARAGCGLSPRIGHVNCHYANILAVQP